MKALVISGGGSKGAWAGGFAEYLIAEENREYDIFVACSTGSLLIPFLASKQIDIIKDIYTNVQQHDIFDVSPFKVKIEEDGTIKANIDHLNSFIRFLTLKKTFGEHNNLRKTIQRILTPERFDHIRTLGKQIIVTVANISTNKTVYKHLHDCEYEDFIDWMWASTSFVPFMSLVQKNGYEYADGGFGNYLPIEEAINHGATEIDVIVLNPRHNRGGIPAASNIFDLLLKTMSFMHSQLCYQDILIGHLESIYNEDVKVNFHFTPDKLTNYSFVFHPSQMKRWWQEGFDAAKEKFSKKS